MTFALEIWAESLRDLRRTSISFGWATMELPIKKMGTKHGFTFQWKVFPKESSWLLHLRIWIIKPSYMGKDWSQCSGLCPTLRRNGGGYSQRSIISLTKMTNSYLNSNTCSAISQMRSLTSPSLTHSVTKNPKTKSLKSKRDLNQLALRKTFISIGKQSTIQLKVGKWK